MKGVTAIMTAVMLSACQPNSAPDIRVENAHIRLPAPGQSIAVAYFDIVNAGGGDRLLSVATPISAQVELHTHLVEGDVMMMRKLEIVDIAAQQTTSFESGGLHVMIFDVNIKTEAKTLPLQLHFARSKTIEVIATITIR